MTIKHFTWASTESEAAELQAQGWKVAEQKIVHHHEYGMLLIYEGELPNERRLPHEQQ